MTKIKPAVWIIVAITLFAGMAGAEETKLSEDRIIEWIKTHVPKIHDELTELKKEGPDNYHEELKEIAEKIAYIEEVRERDPEMADRLIEAENLEIQSWELAEVCALAKDEEEKKKIAAQLKQVLDELFDIRLQEKSLEIKELEREIKEIRVLLDKRKTMKKAIIERRAKEMITSHDESLEWW